MKLQIIERKRFTVTAYIRESGSGDKSLVALDELGGLGSQYAGSARGVISLFKIYAEHGRLRPHGVTLDQMHHANNKPDILEFIKGDIRVFCFIDGDMVVLTNTGLKKRNKADPKDVAKAIKIFDRYFQEKKLGRIEIMERQKS